jgi:hypothetical protein
MPTLTTTGARGGESEIFRFEGGIVPERRCRLLRIALRNNATQAITRLGV